MRIIDAYRRGNRYWILLEDPALVERGINSPEVTVEELLLRAADRKVDIVSISADHPGENSKELIGLLRGLQRMGKSVELSISPLLTELLSETLGMVNAYIINCDPVDGIPVIQYPDFHHSLGILFGRNVIIRRRIGSVDPTFEEVVALGESAGSVASLAILHQFGSSLSHDPPYLTPANEGASEERMLKLGRVLTRYLPKVILRGEGFRVELSPR